jgi:hypothetical protein
MILVMTRSVIVTLSAATLIAGCASRIPLLCRGGLSEALSIYGYVRLAEWTEWDEIGCCLLIANFSTFGSFFRKPFFIPVWSSPLILLSRLVVDGTIQTVALAVHSN